ncbi:MAG: hypothetical protein H0T45_01640 [Pyrinomonadaceae bacterium]|nr:hypothetical protein [Pyrinomonadaceae bacterium]
MKTVAGIFQNRADAERAVESLRALGVADRYIDLLSPGTSAAQLDAQVTTTETEQPGMGKALGGTVGGAMGAAGGVTLGAAAASLLIPGVGPVIAAGLIGAALFGVGGAAAGAAAGNALEDNIAEGLPHDELYVYEDALRQGRTVVIAVAEDGEPATQAQDVLAQAGAESVDAAREDWWIGLRDAEKEQYTAEQGRDFETDETLYRQGYEAAHHPRARGLSLDQSAENLRGKYGDSYEHPAFRRGYERGQRRYSELRESRQS